MLQKIRKGPYFINLTSSGEFEDYLYGNFKQKAITNRNSSGKKPI
jgi:hypothetical protein